MFKVRYLDAKMFRRAQKAFKKNYNWTIKFTWWLLVDPFSVLLREVMVSEAVDRLLLPLEMSEPSNVWAFWSTRYTCSRRTLQSESAPCIFPIRTQSGGCRLNDKSKINMLIF